MFERILVIFTIIMTTCDAQQRIHVFTLKFKEKSYFVIRVIKVKYHIFYYIMYGSGFRLNVFYICVCVYIINTLSSQTLTIFL